MNDNIIGSLRSSELRRELIPTFYVWLPVIGYLILNL